MFLFPSKPDDTFSFNGTRVLQRVIANGGNSGISTTHNCQNPAAHKYLAVVITWEDISGKSYTSFTDVYNPSTVAYYAGLPVLLASLSKKSFYFQGRVCIDGLVVLLQIRTTVLLGNPQWLKITFAVLDLACLAVLIYLQVCESDHSFKLLQQSRI